MILLVGLGNPGHKYEYNRHNVGQILLAQYVDGKNGVWKKESFGSISTFTINSSKVITLFPSTYMNLSGKSVAKVLNFYKIPLECLLVIHDELDLPFGQLSFKSGGGFAGHNGLKSIGELTGKNSFHRVRVGISRPDHPEMPVASYVLQDFSSQEQDLLRSDVFKSLATVVDNFLLKGPEDSVKKFRRYNTLS